MAVTTTAEDIVFLAYAKSDENLDDISAAELELLGVVNAALYSLFQVAARINPFYFASVDADVAYNAESGGWIRPEEAESVVRIEGQGTEGGNVAAGIEVVTVPLDDQGAEADAEIPALYRFGRVYRTPGGDHDPNETDQLTFYYARRPQIPETLADTLDPDWPEQFNELLAFEVTIHLAVKDGRFEEVPALVAARNQWLTRFVAFLEHETVTDRVRFGNVRRFNVNTLLPLLAGGGAE